MSRSYRLYNTIRFIIDTPILVVAYLLAEHWPERPVFSHPELLIPVCICIAAWYLAAYASKLYSDRRYNSFAEEIIFILYTLILFLLLTSSCFFFFYYYSNNPPHSPFFLMYFSCLLFIALVLVKYVIRKYLHALTNQGKLYDRILLVGATEQALDFYETVNRHQYYGYRCTGIVSDVQVELPGCPYLGTTAALPSVLTSAEIHEVVIALPNSSQESIRDCIQVCDRYGVKVRIIPDFYQYATTSYQVHAIGLIPVINLRALPLDKTLNKRVKRAFDFLFSLLFFLLAGWWLIPLIALVIKCTSKGNVFFKQERWGLNNKKINCYKFRTMHPQSPDTDGNGRFLQAREQDERVTPLGRFLRKSSLDELPQFWNVLTGSMSVVGPRPHAVPMNLELMHTVDNYMLRHLVKPGITGWAQVNGCRGEIRKQVDIEKRTSYDLYYIHRWNFWLDCQIILQTIINIIRGDQNAY